MSSEQPTCYTCGRPATVTDGIVGADLCDSDSCLDVAWDRAFEQTCRHGGSPLTTQPAHPSE